MRGSLRVKFFKWLALHTVIIFVSVLTVMMVFNAHEAREHPGLQAEEFEEALVLGGLIVVLFPVALVGAWWISRQLVQPLQKIVVPAEEICAGKLEQRIQPEVADDEIGRLARTLNSAFDRYDEALARLERFSYDAAHQLRNPLAALRTTGETCLQQDRPPGEYRAVIGGMLEDVHRLTHTVNQLLTLARLAHDDLRHQFAPVTLNDLVREVAADAQPVCETKPIELRLTLPTEPVLIRGLTNLLQEALANLLDNALRFTPAAGVIAINLTTPQDGWVTLIVEDSGPGIPENQRAEMFRPFQKTGRDLPEGTGLGLAIVADVVRLHRGTVELATSPLGGCRFTIRLPG
ncbi:MAG: Adaptive-response sensory-kinase SasA [Verrucomicrobiae bacterium]|nr:Adaptive-response sensory-kinase SasA [Verrucomicrobiae bacterium]